MFKLIMCILIVPLPSMGLENGLARTPPMGWLTWERFRCTIDCVVDPYNCISERLIMDTADSMVSEGYADVGYEYIIIDDCWMAPQRDENGILHPDPVRFPSGLTALGKYIHSKGLKFGIYQDFGTKTCGGYPGIVGHMHTDAQTFGEWGVDYVKLDGCYSDPFDMDKGYTDFGRLLNATGRNMIYSCSWPVYQSFSGMEPNYTLIMETCNLWRNYGDIQDSWTSVESIIDYYGWFQKEFIPLNAPGHWNDPDMLIVGNYGLSLEQSMSQMAMWAMWSSPLIMSNDLRSTRAEFKAILQNKKVIGMNQDPLGIQAGRIYKAYSIEIWRKPVTPLVGNWFSYGIAILNRKTDGIHARISRKVSHLGLKHKGGYRVEELFSGMDYGFLYPHDELIVFVNPTGTALLLFTAQ